GGSAVGSAAPCDRGCRGRAGGRGDAWMHGVMGELRSMRVMIEDQMGALAFGDAGRMAPGKARAVRLLSAAGFSAALIRKITARLPDTIDETQALAFVRAALRNNLDVAASEAELLDQGGVFALVGPTGAGKTTTVAKLAARFVVRHGAENLALLTTDGYRIGGQEQLRIYGRILGVAVHAVKDAEDLRRTLGELRNRKLVLIDTVGLSQRDRLVAEQHRMFADCGAQVKRLLLLNATCHGDTLGDVVRAYRGDGLAGCILTKLDEAAAPGAALDTAIRQRLKVFYAADGQRVPEDLHLPVAAKLVDRALDGVAASAQAAPGEQDFPFELPPVHLSAPGRELMAASEVLHG
ncbi:MAG: flagellar biosynthesis protein FlhF, partial [Pseudomonadota bacterium]|nr:flagellar biosynthesis protein FlhF [Pseudomonadota bacterium]